mgnify:CR=1 FL=1
MLFFFGYNTRITTEVRRTSSTKLNPSELESGGEVFEISIILTLRLGVFYSFIALLSKLLINLSKSD